MSSSPLSRPFLAAAPLLCAALSFGCGGGGDGDVSGHVDLGQSTAAVTLSGYEVVSQETATDSSASKQLQIQCPSGKKA